jgi:hypothetical protein
MINEAQNTAGPDDLEDDIHITTTQDEDEADVQTEDNFDEEGNVINEYDDNEIEDMSDES